MRLVERAQQQNVRPSSMVGLMGGLISVNTVAGSLSRICS